MATKTTKKMAPTKGPMKMKEKESMMTPMKKGGASMPAYKKGGSMKKGKC